MPAYYHHLRALCVVQARKCLLEAAIIISVDVKVISPNTAPKMSTSVFFFFKRMLQVQDFQIRICPLLTITLLQNFFPYIYNLHTAEWD